MGLTQLFPSPPNFFLSLTEDLFNRKQRTTMRTPMKTQDPLESLHDYRNTVVGFRITQDEQMKLKSIQRVLRTKGIRGTTSDALRMILHTFDLQGWSLTNS